MIESFSTDRLLELYAGLRHHETGRDDCQVTLLPAPGTGASLRRLLIDEMHAWYLRMLDSAPVHLLPVLDYSGQCVAARSPQGAVRLTLPATVRRVVSLRIDGWERDAQLITDPSSPLALRQANPYACGSTAHPVAVAQEDGRTWMLYPSPAGSAPVEVSRLMAVPEPEPDLYRLDRALLDFQ